MWSQFQDPITKICKAIPILRYMVEMNRKSKRSYTSIYISLLALKCLLPCSFVLFFWWRCLLIIILMVYSFIDWVWCSCCGIFLPSPLYTFSLSCFAYFPCAKKTKTNSRDPIFPIYEWLILNHSKTRKSKPLFLHVVSTTQFPS